MISRTVEVAASSTRRKESTIKIHALLLFATFASGAFAQDTCAAYNFTTGPFNHGLLDGYQHSSGDHADATVASGSCTYSGYFPCNTTDMANSVNPGVGDTGSLTEPGYHVGRTAVKSGVATSNGGVTVEADTESAAAFESCLVKDCAFSISGSGQGGGFTLTFPTASIWNDSYYYNNTCIGIKSGSGGGNGCSRQKPDGTGSQLEPDGTWQECACCPQCECSPVVIDTTGQGFHFTDAKTHCVTFDIKGDGQPICLAWTEHGSGNAWLALPKLEKDGLIVSTGKELFGNYTPQPHHPSQDPNGLLALAEYDMPANGGNLDGIIDQRDAVWLKLRLWIDEHCYLHPELPCTSLPEELHRPEALGVHNISLIYSGDPTKRDQYGNRFKFYSHMNVAGDSLQESPDSRLLWDVYLKQK